MNRVERPKYPAAGGVCAGSVEDLGYVFINQESVHSWSWKVHFSTLYSEVSETLVSPAFDIGHHKFEMLLFSENIMVDHVEGQTEIFLGLCERSNAHIQYSIDMVLEPFDTHVTFKEKYVKSDSRVWTTDGGMNLHASIVDEKAQTQFITDTIRRKQVVRHFKVHCQIYGLNSHFDVTLRLQKLNNLEKLLNNEKCSDLKIQIKDETIYVHKAILVVGNEVFSSMFNHDLEESNSNIIHIDDVDYEVMLELLRYIYVGRVNELENMSDKLMIAADKYCMEDLKCICERYISHTINADNVLESLILADCYNAKILKESAKTFIKNNSKKVVSSSKFKETIKIMHSDLVVELFESINIL